MLSPEPLLQYANFDCIGHCSDIALWIHRHSCSLGALIIIHRQESPRLYEKSKPWRTLVLYGRKGWSKLVYTLRNIAQCRRSRHLWKSWFFRILEKSKAQKFQNGNGTLNSISNLIQEFLFESFVFKNIFKTVSASWLHHQASYIVSTLWALR